MVGRSSTSPLTGHRRRRHGCCYLFAAGTVRQAAPPTAAAGRPPSSPPTTAMPTTAQPHLPSPLTAPVGAAAANSSVCRWQRGNAGDHRRRNDRPPSLETTQWSPAYLPPRPPVTAAVAMAAATSLQRVRLGKRYRRPPPPPRPTVATSNNYTAVGRVPSSPPISHRHRCHGCCYLFAAGTVRQAVPATAAATTIHRRRRRQQHSRRPLTTLATPRSPRPSTGLLSSRQTGYG